MLIGLLDCNNFYVSCERLFNPRLLNRPVVVLSNNDGCVIARSNEAKALNIPMGAPYFEIRLFLQRVGGVAVSSNYALYGDLSDRVMHIVRSLVPQIDVYSIDEAFFDADVKDPLLFAGTLKETVLKQTGIPVSVGIGRTKTLAKAANKCAKKSGGFHFLTQSDEADLLQQFPVEDLWGIGHRWTLLLKSLNCKTALDLRDADDAWIRKHLGIVGLRVASELRGVCCFPLKDGRPLKGTIATSRMFGRATESLDDILESVSAYSSKAAEKLRKEGLLASCISVCLVYHPFRAGARALRVVLPEPTDFTPALIAASRQAVKTLYKAGRSYRKAGIVLEGLVPKSLFQQDLFHSGAPDLERRKRAMQAIDAVNKSFGKESLVFASEGLDKKWSMRQSLRSNRFTTRWDEILKVKI
ncbi:Y-family DNA polymerase [Estrella lausannensis]|uniref:Protein UmuC n=1 Tax=Estrella lausannensis TaxID=483423 RepID=A0A0H5DNW9_9BACT|nr:Y-family DNA polymerase [Estrella lausannensis]CRX37553.1 Protein UmuC [Estrella lausannensis]